jgi:peptidyl-dipeptidase Dcp
MQALADRNGDCIKIQPWDYRYYMEKVRKEKYDLDDNELRPYLQLDKLRDSMFFVAGKLFGMKFSPVENVSVFHPEVKVWEVKRSNGHLGLFYFDPFARSGKRSGAWMSDYREQSRLDKVVTPIVSNNSNFVKGKPGEPALISWDDATTLFHEFGHALHGLSSNVTYPSLSGTNVVRDYVEFPSQLLEHWLMTPEVLEQFAVHYQTGKPIPAALVGKLKRAATFNQGFGTTEYLASAMMDMKLHLTTQPVVPHAFEKETLDELGMPSELVMRHRTPQFLHVFSNDDYAAGYYSYLWADVITADAYLAFEEATGPYDQRIAKKLFDNVLSAGNTVDPDEGYYNFRGKAPAIDALLKKRGFVD